MKTNLFISDLQWASERNRKSKSKYYSAFSYFKAHLKYITRNNCLTYNLNISNWLEKARKYQEKRWDARIFGKIVFALPNNLTEMQAAEFLQKFLLQFLIPIRKKGKKEYVKLNPDDFGFAIHATRHNLHAHVIFAPKINGYSINFTKTDLRQLHKKWKEYLLKHGYEPNIIPEAKYPKILKNLHIDKEKKVKIYEEVKQYREKIIRLQEKQLQTFNLLKKIFPDSKINVVLKQKKIGKILSESEKPSINEFLKLVRWYNSKGWDIFLNLNSNNVLVLDDIDKNNKKINILEKIAVAKIETSPNNYHYILKFDKPLNIQEKTIICKFFEADMSHKNCLTRMPFFKNVNKNFYCNFKYLGNRKIVLDKIIKQCSISLPVKEEKKQSAQEKQTRKFSFSPTREGKKMRNPEEIYAKILANTQDFSRADYVFVFRALDAGYEPETIEEMLIDIAKTYNRYEKKTRGYWQHTVQKALESYIPPESESEEPDLSM